MSRLDFTEIIRWQNVSDVSVLSENAVRETHPFIYPTCEVKNGGFLIFDFGKELRGRLNVLFGWNDANRKVRIRLGESVAEVCAEIGESNAGNYHSLRDNEYNVVSWGSIATSDSGYRYARIDVIEGESVKIASVFSEEEDNGLTVFGDFNCSDEQLNKIYKTAERTVALCVGKNDVWDGIKRDRVFWMGDFYPELLAAYLIYGNIPQFETVLNNIKYFDGHWVNDIPSYSAWWIICLKKYLDLSGNEEYVKGVLPYVDKVVKDFSVIIDENGNVSYAKNKLVYFGGNEFFIDWPTHGKSDSEIGWRYLVSYAMQCAEKICSAFGADGSLAKSIIKRLDIYGFKPSSFKQITALGVIAGKVNAEEAREALKSGGTSGMTAFMSFAIIEALRTIGEGEFALSIIKEYFGAMIKLGATTFWEDFNMEWLKDEPSSIEEFPSEKRKNVHADFGRFCYQGLRHSLCHGWSCGFVDFLYKYVLGVVPVEKGYKTIKSEPHLCGMNFVEGKVPTPYGVIEVKHCSENGKINTEIKLPRGVNKI